MDRHTLQLGLDWSRWTPLQKRWQVNLNWKHDFNSGENAWLFSLVWHGGNGRGLRDVRPGEMDFFDLRRLRSFQVENNTIGVTGLE